jgi:ABC-type dipeptide/oligopeptide/nickel transport system permease component
MHSMLPSAAHRLLFLTPVTVFLIAISAALVFALGISLGIEYTRAKYRRGDACVHTAHSQSGDNGCSSLPSSIATNR